LFCGDCLFAAGCGRIFEGNPAQMLDSLAKLSTLPADSLVCCAHEYTLSNLRFAKAAHPDHPVITARLSEAESMRERDLSTVPSLLMHELQTNPFFARAGRSGTDPPGRAQHREQGRPDSPFCRIKGLEK